jgi:membrane protease YdiL (CAAX protease family)
MNDDTQQARRGLGWVFRGSQGLRAGWGIAIFVLIFAGASAVTVLGLILLKTHSPKGADALRPIGVIVQEGVTIVGLLIATVVTALIERRKLSNLNLSLKGFFPRIIQGLVTGLAALSLLIGLLWLCRAITFGPIVMHGADVWRWGAGWGLAFIMVGLAEEFMFRGYLLQTLARGLNFRWAAVIMAALFGLAHGGNPGETPIGLGIVVLVAFVFSLSIWKTGTLWWALGFHASWDWAQSFLYGVADSGHPAVGALMSAKAAGPDWLSGGSDGPEGSVLAVVVMLVVIGLILLTQRKPDEPPSVKW